MCPSLYLCLYLRKILFFLSLSFCLSVFLYFSPSLCLSYSFFFSFSLIPPGSPSISVYLYLRHIVLSLSPPFLSPLSGSRSFYMFVSVSLPSLSFIHSVFFSFFLSLSHSLLPSPSLSFFLSLALSLSLTHIYSISTTHIHLHTQTHTGIHT